VGVLTASLIVLFPTSAQAKTSKIQGHGFDTCSTPSVKAMKAWLASPYRTVGFYIGGIARAKCDFSQQSPQWVKIVRGLGWHLMPIYVGHQAKCNSYKWPDKVMSSKPEKSALQGAKAGQDAVNLARRLAIPPKGVIYYDLEHYNASNKKCNASALAYVSAWNQTVKANGYKTGLYNNASDAIQQIANNASTLPKNFVKPDALWFAHWDGINRPASPAYFQPENYKNRVKQYSGGHFEEWGGIAINIDSSAFRGGVVSSKAKNSPAPRALTSGVSWLDYHSKALAGEKARVTPPIIQGDPGGRIQYQWILNGKTQKVDKPRFRLPKDSENKTLSVKVTTFTTDGAKRWRTYNFGKVDEAPAKEDDSKEV
jgi:hypothetical protein